jgi:uncharacterized membrane protein (DUF4010 family)
MPDLTDLQHLSIAAAIGFLIGFEREWRDRSEAKEHFFAGARTFTLVGFVGGLAGLLSAGPALLAVGLAAVAILAAASYWAQARAEPGTGGTTEMALLATYLLGAVAARGEPALAAAGGVGAAILLSLKPRIIGLARAISAREIGAALRFLAISVIVLPIVPDQGYGPYEALNPRHIWWMVVLISGLSFAGYWLTKLFGARGVMVAGLVGGLASSTATTISLSRMLKEGSAERAAGVAGIVAANVVMIARVAVLLFVLSPPTLAIVWKELAAAAAAGAAIAMFVWRGDKGRRSALNLGNPMELRPALIFAALLALITLAARFAGEAYGDRGLYGLAFFAGFADVDALTLAAADQAGGGLIAAEAAGLAVLIAAGANMLVKAAMAWSLAGAGAGVRVAAAFLLIGLAAAGALAF